MDEKGRFLEELRTALGYSKKEVRSVDSCPALFASADDAEVLERIQYRTHVEKQALLRVFQENGAQIHLNVQPVKSLEAAAVRIEEIVAETAPEFGTTRQIIQHDHEDLAALQLWKRFSGTPVHVHTTYPADGEVREKSVASCIGLTVPKWAIADSGTVVQLALPGQPRSTSLVVSVHIALLRLENMLADLDEVYALLKKEAVEHPFVFITGPSKTADIEARLVHGVHGPRRMDILVVDERMAEDTHYKGSGLFPS